MLCVYFLYMCSCVYVYVHAPGHACVFSCVLLYHAHMSKGPLQFLSERSAVDRQSQGQFLALSPRFVCGIPGMCRNVGSDRWRGPPQRQTLRHNPKPPSYPFPPLFLSPNYSFCLHATPCLFPLFQVPPHCVSEEWMSGSRSPLFSLHMVSRGEREVDKLERKGWFNMRTRVQAFPFIFFLLAIFFLRLIDWVWTLLSPHVERYSHSSADGVSGCFWGEKTGLSFPVLVHSVYLSKKLDRYFSK